MVDGGYFLLRLLVLVQRVDDSLHLLLYILAQLHIVRDGLFRVVVVEDDGGHMQFNVSRQATHGVLQGPRILNVRLDEAEDRKLVLKGNVERAVAERLQNGRVTVQLAFGVHGDGFAGLHVTLHIVHHTGHFFLVHRERTMLVLAKMHREVTSSLAQSAKQRVLKQTGLEQGAHVNEQVDGAVGNEDQRVELRGVIEANQGAMVQLAQSIPLLLAGGLDANPRRQHEIQTHAVAHAENGEALTLDGRTQTGQVQANLAAEPNRD